MSSSESATYGELLELMRRRRSVRRFCAEPVPRQLVEKLLEAARSAPSAGNRQPYRFLVVRSRERMARLAAAVRKESERLVAAARPEHAADLAEYVRYFDWFERAPLLLAPIYRSGGPSHFEGTLNRSPLDALASTAAAVMSLLLAAPALGLGACWMTGPLVAEASLRELLAVPEGWSIAALLPVGFPDEEPPPRPRRALEQLVRFLDDAELEYHAGDPKPPSEDVS
jgi:F420 biosynthesis protein FbiB-like protein